MGRKGKKKPSEDSGQASGGSAPGPGPSGPRGDHPPPQQQAAQPKQQAQKPAAAAGAPRGEGDASAGRQPGWQDFPQLGGQGRGRGEGRGQQVQQQGQRQQQQRPGPPQGPQGKRPPKGQQQRQGPPAGQQQWQGPPPGQQQRQGPPPGQQQKQGPPAGQQPWQGPSPAQQQRQDPPPGQEQRQGPPPGQQQRQGPPPGQQQRQGPPAGQQPWQGPSPAQQQRQDPPPWQKQRQGPPPGQQQRQGPPAGQQPWQGPSPAQQQRQDPPPQRQQQQPRKAGDKAGPPVKELEKMTLKDKPISSKQPSPTKGDFKSSVPDNIAKAMVKQIPLRKGEGKLGKPIQVFVNMMELKFGRNFRPDVVHYDVAFDPETPRYLIRPAFQKLQQQHFPKRFPAFDGRKNVFSAGLLPFGESMTQNIEIPNEDGRIKTFKITMNKVNDIDLSWLVNVRRGLPEGERDTISITALDIILRQAPYQNLAITPVGRSFFSQPRGRVVDLGDGLELWVGLFQSAVLGWKPLLNVDVAHKGFPKSQGVLQLMGELCHVQGVPSRQDIDYNREDIEKYLKKLKVSCMIPNQPESKRTYTINGLVKSPKDNFFEHQGNRVSVFDYYRIEKRYMIQYPEIPCLHVGPQQKNIHVPAELCTLLSGQATNKKMNETQTSNMIKHAATSTDIRKQKIMDSFNTIRHNQSPCIQEFGISIGGEFEKIKARVLDPPLLTYNEQDRAVPVMKGVWRASRFNAAKDLPDNSWTILCLDNRTRQDALRNLEQQLREGARALGMNIGAPLTPFGMLQPPTRSLQDIIRFFNNAKDKKLLLVFVVVPDRPPNVYSKVKQVAELNVGVLTQCLKAFTVFKKLNPATISNILLKVNAKLDGVNHTFQTNARPKCLEEPCMIVGADVTHPSPDATGIPSIAAVAASHDPKAFKYNIEIRLQPPRAEVIQNFEEIMIIQLKTFNKQTGKVPRRIIVYRDGVSEGQFPQIMYHELTAIRNACTKMNPNYKPAISFFVVQKRHHIRLFPTDKRNSDDRNFNVQAGTIVDSEITHPSHIDFYLVSHASIQGTARPTKYRCLWDDANMSEDEIEKLTYYLCHMFSRCTRSVSYPTPTYYAHLAAFRARALTQDVKIDVNNLENEQRLKLRIKEDFQNNPMFFV